MATLSGPDTPSTGLYGRAVTDEYEGDFAIVVGINRYKGFKPPLESAVADAERFAEWLKGPGGRVPDEHVTLIRSPPKGRTYTPVLKQINDVFETILKSRDPGLRRLYFYFAGHGCSIGPEHVNLLMADATQDSRSLGINAPDYQTLLGEAAPFPEQLFFYDCCRKGDARAPGQRPTFTPDPIDLSQKQAVFYATLADEPSVEVVDDVDTESRGIFTEALLEGLNGGAVAAHDTTEVTVDSLAGYLERRMAELVFTEGIWQKPDVLRKGFIGEIALTRARAAILPITLKADPSDTRFVVRDAKLRKVASGPVRKVASGPVTYGLGRCDLAVGLHKADVWPSGRERLFDVGPGKPQVIDLVDDDDDV
jgi:uncharacterized caspase-like protein